MQTRLRRVMPVALVGIAVSVAVSILATLVAHRIFGRREGRPWDLPDGELPVFDTPDGKAAVERAYQSVLAQWPVPFTQREVPTSFGLTHVIESGPPDAPPVVLLHAYFATAAAWYRTVGALSREHRVIAVDVIGDANLSRPIRPVTSLDDYRTWFVELLDGLDVRTLSVVGNSFGGFLATHFAIELPERITKLVLIGPASTFRGMSAFYTKMFAPKAAYLTMPWLPGRERAMRACATWMYAGLPHDPVWGDLFDEILLHGTTVNQVFPRVFTREELATIKAPVLLILGDRERIYPAVDASHAARELLPTIQVEIVPEAHHVTAIAQPQLVNAALLGFIDEGRAVAPKPRSPKKAARPASAAKRLERVAVGA